MPITADKTAPRPADPYGWAAECFLLLRFRAAQAGRGLGDFSRLPAPLKVGAGKQLRFEGWAVSPVSVD